MLKNFTLKDKFDSIPFEDISGTKTVRFYQEIAINNVMNAIAEGRQRILLTLATGTGKTFITDAVEILGGITSIRSVFIDFQKYLYEKNAV